MGAEYRADGRGREGRDLSLNRFAHRMHSRFLEQRTISQGSIYAAPAASNRGRGGGRGEDGRRSAYPNSFTYFPLSRKYIRSFYLLSPSFPPSVRAGFWHFFSSFFFFFLWLFERPPYPIPDSDFFGIAIFLSIFFLSFLFSRKRVERMNHTLSFGIYWFIYCEYWILLFFVLRDGILSLSVLSCKIYFERTEQFLIVRSRDEVNFFKRARCGRERERFVRSNGTLRLPATRLLFALTRCSFHSDVTSLSEPPVVNH